MDGCLLKAEGSIIIKASSCCSAFAGAKRVDYLYAEKIFLIVGHDDASVRLGCGRDDGIKATA